MEIQVEWTGNDRPEIPVPVVFRGHALNSNNITMYELKF